MADRYLVHFAARDWKAMTELIADDFTSDDRRRMVAAGSRHGRDAEIENMRTIVDLGKTYVTSTVIATRGQRLILVKATYSSDEQRPEPFLIEILGVVEINADNRIAAAVVFDTDDMGAAFAELETRYLAGEAAAYAHTWSVIASAFAAFNRHELRRDAGVAHRRSPPRNTVRAH